MNNQVTAARVDPRTVEEALSGQNREFWKRAMDSEMDILQENNAWVITSLPSDKQVINSKWVFKTELDGDETKFKARLVAPSYETSYGYDYDEMFASSIKQVTLRILLTVAGQRQMTVKHFNVQSTIFNDDVTQEIYVTQPEGYNPDGSTLVCRLRKGLYGLDKDVDACNNSLDRVLVEFLQFERSVTDPCLYIKRRPDDDGKRMNVIYLMVLVDEIVAATNEESLLEDFEKDIEGFLQIRNLGGSSSVLGIQFWKDGDGYFVLHQKDYIEKKLSLLGFENSRGSVLLMDPRYRNNRGYDPNLDLYGTAVGSLLYVAETTRPDITVAASIVAKKMKNPTQSDWNEVEKIFRYLSETREVSLKLGRRYDDDDDDDNDDDDDDDTTLYCYVHASRDQYNRKATTGYCYFYKGSLIAWRNLRQLLVTTSAAEAEFIALSQAQVEGVYIKRLFKDLGENIKTPIATFEDNQECLDLLRYPNEPQFTKYIDKRYNYVKDLVEKHRIVLIHCPSEIMIADIFARPLDKMKFNFLVNRLGFV